jgi:hypothetical protein
MFSQGMNVWDIQAAVGGDQWFLGEKTAKIFFRAIKISRFTGTCGKREPDGRANMF